VREYPLLNSAATLTPPLPEMSMAKMARRALLRILIATVFEDWSWRGTSKSQGLKPHKLSLLPAARLKPRPFKSICRHLWVRRFVACPLFSCLLPYFGSWSSAARRRVCARIDANRLAFKSLNCY